MIDVVTVYHRRENFVQTNELHASLDRFERPGSFTFIAVDNQTCNRGFAGGCNFGAKRGKGRVIAFLNPDLHVQGPFLESLMEPVFDDQSVVICGERFDKPEWEVRNWGCVNWVCGACMMVRRHWFDKIGGFNPKLCFGYDETWMIRQAQEDGRRVVELDLPVYHR